MLNKLIAEYHSKAKAYLAGAVLAVTAAVGQAGSLGDTADLSAQSYLKAVAVAVVGALAVYLKGNVAKA